MTGPARDSRKEMASDKAAQDGALDTGLSEGSNSLAPDKAAANRERLADVLLDPLCFLQHCASDDTRYGKDERVFSEERLEELGRGGMGVLTDAEVGTVLMDDMEALQMLRRHTEQLLGRNLAEAIPHRHAAAVEQTEHYFRIARSTGPSLSTELGYVLTVDAQEFEEHCRLCRPSYEAKVQTVAAERIADACKLGIPVLTEDEMRAVLLHDLEGMRELRKGCAAWWSGEAELPPLMPEDEDQLAAVHRELKRRHPNYPAPDESSSD